MKILLIDSSWIVRDRLCKIVADFPAILTVAQADTEAAARRQLETGPLAIVIIDPSMCGGNGLVTLAHAKARQPGASVIVLTNLSFPEYRLRCMELGADFFFDKSKETDAFVTQLGTLCASSAARPPGRTSKNMATR